MAVINILSAIVLLIIVVGSVDISSCDCGEEGPISITKGLSQCKVTADEYFEIWFDVEFDALCSNPTGRWGYDAVCGVLQIGDTNHLGSRYPILFVANPSVGNTANYWYTRLQTSSSEGCCGSQINFVGDTSLTSTGTRRSVYVAMTPNSYSVSIDGQSDSITFGSRYIPSGVRDVWLSATDTKAATGNIYNLCIRSSSDKLYDPCDDVTCGDTGNSCTYYECVDGECVAENYDVGHSCADNTKCNGDEACDGNGVCQDGIAVECDDNNVCTENVCDPATGTCSYPGSQALEGTSCSNDDACDGLEECDADGICQNGEPIDCGFAAKCESPDGECVAECDVFDIDLFSEECSSTTHDDLIQMINDVNTRIDNLPKGIRGGRGKKGGKKGGKKKQNVTVISLDSLNKDWLIIILLVINMALFIYICCYDGIKRNKRKYKTVSFHSDEEEENKPINQI